MIESATAPRGGNITTTGTEAVEVWGHQSEALSYQTSYIPTSGASATRNQELCNNATPVINSEEGTLYAEISALENDSVNYKAISLSDGSTTNRVQFSYRQNAIVAYVSSGGVAQYSYAHTVSTTLNNHKIALSYKGNDFKFFVDGELKNSSTSGITFPINTLTKLAFNDGGSANLFGNTKGLKVYPKALADVQLQDLTSWGSFAEMANALNYTIK